MGRALTTSLWADTAPAAPARPPLAGDLDVDVAIVGAGFTGLWTAYYLAEADPGLRIAVLEAEHAGFGASGRNGGWCSALFPKSLDGLAAMSDRERALAQHAAMRATVNEVGSVLEREGIDAHFAHGGTLSLARSRPQLERARAEVAEARAWGRGEDEVRLLDAEEAQRLTGATGVLGATYSPDCAAVHPLRLARGLADAVERRGVRLHERTPVRTLAPGRVTTDRGTVRAGSVLRATEGWTATLPGERRRVAPGLLPGDRHRAAGSPRSGSRSGSAGARRSRTTGT